MLIDLYSPLREYILQINLTKKRFDDFDFQFKPDCENREEELSTEKFL